jgi:L-aspartate oxidase
MIGGVTIDESARTTLPGLWAAGEVTSSGLHGANRLASNSLLEGLVYGARAADDIVECLSAEGRVPLEVPAVEHLPEPLNGRDPIDLADVRDSLRALMWRHVGIIRDAAGLAEASEQVDFWCGYVLNHTFDDPAGWVLQNMLTVARLMIAAAQIREESRGVHTRTDFPDPSPAWKRHVSLRRPSSDAIETTFEAGLPIEGTDAAT